MKENTITDYSECCGYFILFKKDSFTVEKNWFYTDVDYIIYDECGKEIITLRTNICTNDIEIEFWNRKPKRYKSKEKNKIFKVTNNSVFDEMLMSEKLIELIKTDKIKNLFVKNSDEAYQFINKNIFKNGSNNEK